MLEFGTSRAPAGKALSALVKFFKTVTPLNSYFPLPHLRFKKKQEKMTKRGPLGKLKRLFKRIHVNRSLILLILFIFFYCEFFCYKVSP